MVSSVVPRFTSILKKLFKSPNSQVFFLGQNLKLPIAQNYKGLGQDRVVNLYGAFRMHTSPCLIIDYGTAVTFDLITRSTHFEGGLIIPGPEISFQNLLQRAALLPKAAKLPKKAKSFLGLNTYDAMSSGILQGYGAMTDGLIERFKKRYGKKLYVIATGGFATHLKPYFTHVDLVDPKHSMKSLLSIYHDLQAGVLRSSAHS